MEVGDRIRAIRKRKGLQQIDLADLLNISQRAYSKLENGETQLTIARLQKIAQFLNVSTTELLGKPNGIVLNNATTSDNERKLYEQRIVQQQKEIDFLKGLINTLQR